MGTRPEVWRAEELVAGASYLVHVAQPGLSAGMRGQRAPALLEPGYLPGDTEWPVESTGSAGGAPSPPQRPS